MKTLLIILLSTTAAFADWAVIVKSTGIVVSKEAYFGDTSVVPGRLAKRANADPSLTFQILDLDVKGNQATFDAAVVPKTERDQAKIDLNTATKTDTQRIDAIIKYLELNK